MLILLIITAFCWGVTNVFIKQGSTGIEHVKADNRVTQVFEELKFLILNWKVTKKLIEYWILFKLILLQYLLPFLINQCGSLIYVYALQLNNLSVAVIVTNSLTLLFTSITSIIIEKKTITYRQYLGALLISSGASLCVISSQIKV